MQTSRQTQDRPPFFAAIILAAGESRRMGTQKALLPFAGKTVIAHIADQFVHSRVDQTYVVTGHAPAGIERALAALPVTIVHNPDYRDGMLSSVRAGLRALPPETRVVFVALGDQPTVTTAVIDSMNAAFGDASGILVPVHDGRRGHPLLLSMRYRGEILSQYDDVGLRGLLHAHPEAVRELVAEDAGVLMDMDTPDDYEALRKSHGAS